MRNIHRSTFSRFCVMGNTNFMSLDSDVVAVVSDILIMYEMFLSSLLKTSVYDLNDFSIGSVLSISSNVKSYKPTTPDR